MFESTLNLAPLPLMTSAAEEHSATSHQMLAKAGEALAADDLVLASEKLWGAAAHMVKGVAERRGWPHAGPRELFKVINRLIEDTGDRDLGTLFSVAISLRSNSYENWLPREWVEADLDRVEEFLEKLEALA